MSAEYLQRMSLVESQCGIWNELPVRWRRVVNALLVLWRQEARRDTLRTSSRSSWQDRCKEQVSTIS